MQLFVYIFSLLLLSISQQVVNHPRNRGIISRLCDLTGPEAVSTFRSRTIQWSCLMALQLLHLSPVKIRQNVSSDRAVRIPRRSGSSASTTSSSTTSSPSKALWSPSRKKKSKRKTKKKRGGNQQRSSASTNAIDGSLAKKKLF